jgi:hypothetical protein
MAIIKAREQSRAEVFELKGKLQRIGATNTLGIYMIPASLFGEMGTCLIPSSPYSTNLAS